MQVIIGYCDLLMMDRETGGGQRDKVNKIIGQIERLGDITRKLTNINTYATTDYLEERIIDIDKSAPSPDNTTPGEIKR